jgi:hypothetical protein
LVEIGLKARKMIAQPRAAAFTLPVAGLLMLCGCPGASAAAPAPGLEAICRAAIGSLMDRDPKAFRVTRSDGEVLFLSYVRPIDNFDWTYRCKLRGNRVIWGSEPGRWREGPKDDKVSFEMVAGGKQLRIVDDRGNGSSTKAIFDLDKLQ